MNWYKAAAKTAVSVTPAEFGAMDRDEKEALMRNPNISLLTQRLFFTEDYGNKHEALRHLALNPKITQETQRLFFTEKYEYKGWVLYWLAKNSSITPATQLLFFTETYKSPFDTSQLGSLARSPSIAPETQRLLLTEEYENKGAVLEYLALNESIAPETQLLFFTEEYPDKNDVLEKLRAWNPSFLRDFTTAQWRSIKNAARGVMRLLVLSKRLEKIAGVP